MQRRCERNRKRSKRRAIYCPIHGCYLHSVSQKYTLFTDSAKQMHQRRAGQKNAQRLVATQTKVLQKSEWLEAFWCDECQQTKWYHVQKYVNKAPGSGRQESSTYLVSVAPQELWKQAAGVIHPEGNPSVGEFTRRHARMVGYKSSKDFRRC